MVHIHSTFVYQSDTQYLFKWCKYRFDFTECDYDQTCAYDKTKIHLFGYKHGTRLPTENG